MKGKISYFLALVSLLFIQGIAAQENMVSGMVTDATNGSPLPGVNVLVQGTTTGTQTDFDGNYSINASDGSILVFSRDFNCEHKRSASKSESDMEITAAIIAPTI
mgnify:CR=1 FL=1